MSSGRGGKREPGPGKKLGRPSKPKIELTATKGIATDVLGTIDERSYWLWLLHFDEFKDKDQREELTRGDRQEIREALIYLTNRRDGKPAQGVFVGDTRERARDLDFGDLPDLVTAGQSAPARKPN